eukprot:405839_1
MTDSEATWILLSPHRKQGNHIRAFPMNDVEFLIVDGSVPHFIHKYNIRNNKWNKIFKFNTNLQRLDRCGIFFDKQTECLYLVAGDSSQILYEVNIHKNTVNILSHQVKIERLPYVITIDSKVHIIGSDNEENKHFIYDTNMKTITDISSYNYDLCEDIIHLESRNSMIMVGKDKSYMYQYEIYEFSLINNKWSKWNMRIPLPTKNIYTIKSRNEQYILIICRLYILVLNIQSGEFKQSKLEYPCNPSSTFTVINMNSKTKDEKLVFGYVKKCLKSISSAFDIAQHLPHDLINCISGWFSFEMIHFMLSTDQHWKINIDDILCLLT